MKIVLAIVLAVDPHGEAISAMERGHYVEAGRILADVAHQTSGERRSIAALQASSAFLLAHERGDTVAACEGLELLRWYFMESRTPGPPTIRNYWALVSAAGDSCRPPPNTTANEEHRTETTRAVPRPQPNLQPTPVDTRTPRGLRLGGYVALSFAGVGGVAIAAQGVVFHRHLEAYKRHDGHDEQLYQAAKTAERWLIGTGVTACVAIATGVTLLAIARRKVNITPHATGLIVQGMF